MFSFETQEFEINAVYGDVMDPIELNITTTVDLSIALIAGYNWISFNVFLFAGYLEPHRHMECNHLSNIPVYSCYFSCIKRV